MPLIYKSMTIWYLQLLVALVFCVTNVLTLMSFLATRQHSMRPTYQSLHNHLPVVGYVEFATTLDTMYITCIVLTMSLCYFAVCFLVLVLHFVHSLRPPSNAPSHAIRGDHTGAFSPS